MTPQNPHPPDPLNTHIDRTLHALAHPPAPERLNHRILATLATRHAPTPNRLATLLRRHALPLAAASILLLLATLRLLQPHPANLPPPRIASRPATVTQPPTAPSAPPPTAHLHLTRQSPQPPIPNPNQQALADLQTPSFPAPPLPPTPQERLVRLMLRRGEIHNLAQLNPADLAATTQHDNAFDAFFDPVIPRLPSPETLLAPPPQVIPQPQPQTQGNPNVSPTTPQP